MFLQLLVDHLSIGCALVCLYNSLAFVCLDHILKNCIHVNLFFLEKVFFLVISRFECQVQDVSNILGMSLRDA